MQPEEQIQKLHEAMDLLNKGNASQKEVVEMFETLARAIKDIREDLDTKIKESGEKYRKTDEKARTSLLATERRLSEAVAKLDKASQLSLKGLKSEFLAELKAVRQAIPDLPDFQGMLRDIEAKIPSMPEMPQPVEYKAGRNISIEDDTITNTNPKITVSRERPENPEVDDIWIQ